MLRERFDFLKSFVSRPFRTGAVAPSSSVLARALIHGLDFSSGHPVLEIGPGTGAVTQHLIAQHPSGAEAIQAIELNEDFAKILTRRVPGLRVHQDSAEHLDRYTDHGAHPHGYHVVSSLPWTLFNPGLRERILKSVQTAVASDSTFVTYAYAHADWTLKGRRRLRPWFEPFFEEIEVSEVVWWNLPPAVVYRCRNPKKT